MQKVRKAVLAILPLSLIAAAVVIWITHSNRSKLSVPITDQPPPVALEKVLEQQGISLPSLPVASGDTLIASISGVNVYFSSEKDFTVQGRALQLVLSRLKMGSKPKIIDLRYTKVILRF